MPMPIPVNVAIVARGITLTQELDTLVLIIKPYINAPIKAPGIIKIYPKKAIEFDGKEAEIEDTHSQYNINVDVRESEAPAITAKRIFNTNNNIQTIA